MSTWPGFNRKKTTNYLPGFGPITSRNTAEIVDFELTSDVVQADAEQTAKIWMRATQNKMTLSSVRKGADANNDGLIDASEFKALMAASGYKGSAQDRLFAQIDQDGDGVLTEAEIKLLSQGSATLKSGKV